jgi:hypothetical protein
MLVSHVPEALSPLTFPFYVTNNPPNAEPDARKLLFGSSFPLRGIFQENLEKGETN